MKITIKKIDSQVLSGNVSGVANTYRVIEDGRVFLLTRTSHSHGSSISMAGEGGILYVDAEDDRVHRQVVSLSGACGLNTDDEPVEGLSPLALRGLFIVDLCSEQDQVTITKD